MKTALKPRRAAITTKAALLALVLVSSPVWSQPCRLVEMKVSGEIAQTGKVSVDLGEASPPDPSSPVAYQGPPRIRVGDGPACMASPDVSIIAGRPWLGPGIVYFSTYSGSENRVYAVDVKDCHTVWSGPLFEGAPAAWHNGQLVMGSHHVALDRMCLPARRKAG